MKLKEAVEKALKEKNFYLLGQVVDTLRFRCGMDYNQTLEWFQQNIDPTMNKFKFEDLMYQIDEGG